MNEIISDMMVDTWNLYSIAGMKVKYFIVYANSYEKHMQTTTLYLFVVIMA